MAEIRGKYRTARAWEFGSGLAVGTLGGVLVPTSDVRELLDNPAELSEELACLVERVCRNSLPWVVVAGCAVAAWEERDPVGWEKVSAFLAANGIAIVRI